MKLLLVEDNPELRRSLARSLAAAGYVVEEADNGEDAAYLGSTAAYDAVILDLGLPQIDGLAVMAGWRREGISTPILVLTARGSWREKVQGLRGGADDYVTKPFSTEEVLARIEALIRRSKGHSAPRLARRGRDSADRARVPHARLSRSQPGPRRLAGRADRASLRPGFRARFQRDRGDDRAAAPQAGAGHHRDPAGPRLPGARVQWRGWLSGGPIRSPPGSR
jgi:CheY-like chemotaxis protein